MTRDRMLAEAIARIFSDHYTAERLQKAKAEGWSPELWASLEETGMTLLSVPEDKGGGGDLTDAVEALRLAGGHCAAVPFAETALLAGWALAKAEMPVPQGPLAVAITPYAGAPEISRDNRGWRLTGTLKEVAWAGIASHLVLVTQVDGAHAVLCLPRASYEVNRSANLAGESRDDVIFKDAALSADQVRVGVSAGAEEAYRRGALSRALLISGALDRVLELTLQYTKQRVQFDRPLVKFQAVQQELAGLAGEAAIAKAIALSAAAHIEDDDAEHYVAAAKVKCGEAAHKGSAIAHQLHGAIGVTEEYLLHYSTLRLWSWRSEYGTEAQWAQRLGARALERGSEKLWASITD